MDIRLRITLIIMLFSYLGIIFYFLKKKILNLKYSLIWLLAAVSLLVIIIFPAIIPFLSSMFGIYDPVNMLFLLIIFFILLILLSITAIVSKTKSSINSLTQEIAILEKKIRDMNL